MEQVLNTAVLWFLGSKKPAVDCARLLGTPVSQNPTSIGRKFEDKIIQNTLPQIALKLDVNPPSNFYRITRHSPYCGDISIYYKGQVGIVELKNHSRSLSIADRRRFFDTVMVNYRNINWAMLVTSRCSIPRFGERGSTVIGRLKIDLDDHQKIIPLAFVCDLETRSEEDDLKNAITSVTEGWSRSTIEWKASELLVKGDITRSNSSRWGKGDRNLIAQHSFVRL